MDQTSQQSAGQVPEQRDVSRQTMVVLVILAIMVSLLGTFTVLRETNGVNKVIYKPSEVQTGATESAQGQVLLNIVDRSTFDSMASKKTKDLATGKVTFTIVPSEQ